MKFSVAGHETYAYTGGKPLADRRTSKFLK